jgi:hypothetical protein
LVPVVSLRGSTQRLRAEPDIRQRFNQKIPMGIER